MSSKIERYFSCLTKEQLAKASELALALIKSGTDPQAYFYIRFAGDISENPEDVVELLPSRVLIDSVFTLEEFSNCLNLNISSLPIQQDNKKYLKNKDKKKEVISIVRQTVNQILNTHDQSEKNQITECLRSNIQQIKSKYTKA